MHRMMVYTGRVFALSFFFKLVILITPESLARGFNR